MPTLLKELEATHKAQIRRHLVYNPDASAGELAKTMGRDHRYITRLLKKIRAEQVKRMDGGTRRRISELQDHFKTMVYEVRAMIQDERVPIERKAALLITLFEENVHLFKIEQSVGLREKVA